jgi:hypothetical protein
MKDALEEKGLTPCMSYGFKFVGDLADRPVPIISIDTKKRNGHRGNALVLKYCPFCGKEYNDPVEKKFYIGLDLGVEE